MRHQVMIQTLEKLRLKVSDWVLMGTLLCGMSAAATEVVYEFGDGSDLDNTGINARMTTNGLTITTAEIVGWDGTLASTGIVNKMNIVGNANGLGINSKTIPPNAGNDARDFDPGEAWTFFFDADIYLLAVDLASLDVNSELTISSPGFPALVISDDGGRADVYSLGKTMVSAGTPITITNTSAESTANESHDFRITSLRVGVVTAAESETLGIIAQ
ncbi:hypothetical protein P4C99_04030 [Pontiellaceae bacterium B1224]|nr:hypothetical protein [Pontiellaceae bacterium B1224]